MPAELTALAVLVLVALAEWVHSVRCRRVAVLAFGPKGQPREWTGWVPFARVLGLAMLAWGLVVLFLLDPKVVKPRHVPEGGYRHVIVVLDVSPSMQLRDAGPAREQTRAQRAAVVVLSVLNRIVLEQARVSVVAFYNGAKPVVVDTMDMAVVKNILQDLPLDYAFDVGKTTLIEGIREAAALAKPWKEASTTILVVSDGDTVPDSGMPPMPASVSQVLIVGVGDARVGKFIDGHQSRQDAATLRQMAGRLRGVYHDANEQQLPSDHLAALAKSLPMRDDAKAGRRELALTATGTGACVLALVPLALALAGSSWQAGRNKSKASPTAARSSLATAPDG